MNGTIAQIVAITAYGNMLLSGNIDNDKFLHSNSTAQFCEYIRFIDWVQPGWIDRIFKGKTGYGEKPIANDFESWVSFLKRENVRKLHLHYISSENPELDDRLSAGFVGGGGRWLIEANKGDVSDFWEAKWEVGNQDDKENKIWQVTYVRIARNEVPKTTEHQGIDNITTRLLKELSLCNDFATKNELNGFSNCFSNSIKILKNEDNEYDGAYHKDIIPLKHYSEESKRILIACQPAWVFGGMGSWNDMGFDGDEQKHYEEISERLFYSICTAISYATNEFK